MDLIHNVRHIIRKHVPRKHLLTASLLTVALVLVFMLAPEDQAHGDRVQTLELPADDLRQAMIAALTESSESEDALRLSAGPLPDHLDSATEDLTDYGHWTEIEVKPGDNLSSLFTRVGLSARDLHRLLDSNTDSNILNRLHPGYQLAFHIPEPGLLEELQVLTSPLDGYTFTLRDARYEIEPIRREPETRQTMRQGEIADSLFMAAQRANIPAAVIMQMADIFGGVIDFILDPRQGDEFNLLYEEHYLDGERVGNGPILGARFINRGREHIALRYVHEDGKVGYYTPDGESMQTAFLRNPLDVFRISSNFNPNRRHPILNTIRAHRGTDYAAPTGTPVRATAEGTVTWASRNGSFGNLIVIEHPGNFETKYAHLNGYANGIRRGARVRQGQIIGYVGATGAATGPHLHYEFLVNGIHKDPRTVLDDLPQIVTLEEDELPRFRASTRQILEQFESLDNDGARLLSYTSADFGPVAPN